MARRRRNRAAARHRAPLETHGACHCDGLRFTVRLADGPEKPMRRNCSCCWMKGAVMLFAGRGDFAVTTGEGLLGVYQFRANSSRFNPR